MLIVISPAKNMNFKAEVQIKEFTLPRFLNESQLLIDLLRTLTQRELGSLLGINAALSELNLDRIFNWKLPFSLANSKQAIFAYDGEVFRGFKAVGLSVDELNYAQGHLRILSGLYGVLRPLDLIQPYRLEVSSKLSNPLGDDLYQFWREKATNAILLDLKEAGSPEIILNLASSEYFKTFDFKKKAVKVIDVEFYELKDDALKQIVVYTKKARGLMSRYVIQNRIQDPEDLKGFNDAGYWYSEQHSSDNRLVFVR